jgi:predicted XRE-type DNA-binding protein
MRIEQRVPCGKTRELEMEEGAPNFANATVPVKVSVESVSQVKSLHIQKTTLSLLLNVLSRLGVESRLDLT